MEAGRGWQERPPCLLIFCLSGSAAPARAPELPSSLLNNSIWEEPGMQGTVLMGL